MCFYTPVENGFGLLWTCYPAVCIGPACRWSNHQCLCVCCSSHQCKKVMLLSLNLKRGWGVFNNSIKKKITLWNIYHSVVLCYTIQDAPIKLSAKAKNGMKKSFQSRSTAGLQLWCLAENLSSLESTLELSPSPKYMPWMWASTSMGWHKLGHFGWEHGAVWMLVWAAPALSRGSC